MEDQELVCEDCGTKNNVAEELCPYTEEIYGKEVPAQLCNKCYHERCMDV